MHRDKHKKEAEGLHIPIKDVGNGTEDIDLVAGGIPVDDAAGEGAPAHAPVVALDAELEKARAEAKGYEDKYLRLYADTENFKKRMTRESAEREKYYNEAIIKELLPVMDNLDRALAHGGEGGGSEGILDGVRMVRKQFMDALSRFGVTEVVSVGLPFDPARQQAVMAVEAGDYDDGVGVEELQKGFFLNDRILRPAMVTVAKRPAEDA